MLAALGNFLPSFNNKNVSLGNLTNNRKVIVLCGLVGIRGIVSIVSLGARLPMCKRLSVFVYIWI